MEQRAEAVDFLLEQRPHRFDRDIVTRQPGAAGGDDHVDIVAVGPVTNDVADCAHVILHDLTRG